MTAMVTEPSPSGPLYVQESGVFCAVLATGKPTVFDMVASSSLQGSMELELVPDDELELAAGAPLSAALLESVELLDAAVFDPPPPQPASPMTTMTAATAVARVRLIRR